MPCCAFALFVIGQIAAFCLAIGRALGLSSARDDGPPLNPATAWQLHAAPSAGPVSRRGRRRLVPALALVALLEVGVVAAGAAWLRGGEHAPDATPGTIWCGGPVSAVEVASLGNR
jgi:hypothetical protein